MKKTKNNTTKSPFLTKKKESPNDKSTQSAEINEKYEKIPVFCIVLLSIAAACGIIYTIAVLSPRFADFFNINISPIFRYLFAKITNIFPFSVAEILIILLPLILILLTVYLIKYRCPSFKASLISALCVISVASTIFSSFTLTLATGYRGSTLDEKLGLEQNEVNAQELYDSAEYLSGKLSELSKYISYGDDGFSIMPYSFGEMNEKLLDAYRNFSAKHSFIKTFNSRLKPVILSEPMSYTHITGVYTFFSGESNVNINFPEYTLPYTSAHELAHQRGISREDEANMIAFLVSLESEDSYIQYCAYLNIYEYVISALSKADRELYSKNLSTLDSSVRGEISAYSKFFKKYQDSTASKVSDNVNDAYLKAQGTVGRKSYGMVVDLTVAYLKCEGYIN